MAGMISFFVLCSYIYPWERFWHGLPQRSAKVRLRFAKLRVIMLCEPLRNLSVTLRENSFRPSSKKTKRHETHHLPFGYLLRNMFSRLLKRS